MKKISIFLTAVFAFVLFLPADALACACCAEHGTYSIWTGKPADYDLEVLQGIKFDSKTELFMTEADFEIIKGLDEIKKELSGDTYIPAEFDLTNTFAAKMWKFNIKTKGGKTGTLTLPMPAQILKYKVDIHDGKTVGAGGPLLYKEFRFKGNVQSGTGLFKAGIVSPTSYFLVFQGRGNGCDNAEDFSNWRLEINGKRAQYSFFGKLTSGTDYETQEQ
jgi:hypothetical protein